MVVEIKVKFTPIYEEVFQDVTAYEEDDTALYITQTDTLTKVPHTQYLYYTIFGYYEEGDNGERRQ